MKEDTIDIQRKVVKEKIYSAMSDSSPNFDVKEIVQIGADVLSSSEKRVVMARGSLPVWLTEASDYSEYNENNLYTNLERQLLLAAQPHRVANAVVGPLTRLPARFFHCSGDSPDVYMSYGGESYHYFKNYTKVSWNECGVYREVSDKNGPFYRKFLDEGAAVGLKGDTLAMVVEGATVYTHWLLDTLPRLLLMKENNIDLHEFDNYLFTAFNRKFQHESIKCLGIDAGKIRTRHKEGLLFKCDNFTTVSAVRKEFVTNPNTYGLVKNLFKKRGLKSSSNEYGDRLFISRRKAKKRKIINQDGVISLLRKYGFKPIHFEDHSIEETAAIMDQASYVIGPHGAGLANLVFAPAGISVLEIFSGHISNEYWNICGQLNMKYHVLEALGPDGEYLDNQVLEKMPYAERNGLDMIVDLKQLKLFLDNVFMD